jgi:glycerol-3-phosphate dehydrogenase
VRERSRTASAPLPGGDAPLDVAATSKRFGLGWPAVLRLGFRHGARVPRVLEGGTTPSAPAPRVVCACEPVTDAELRHVAMAEGVRTLGDCSLRVRLGVGACQGAGCAAEAGGILGDALAWSAERTAREVASFLAGRWSATTPALGGAQLAAAEVLRWADAGARGFTSLHEPAAPARPAEAP